MKDIKTSMGQTVKVCDCHYDKVSTHKWSALRQPNRHPVIYYAVRFGDRIGRKPGLILMHREIVDCPEGMVVDHIDGDSSNNQCYNLRICTQGQNLLNTSKPKYNTVSGYRGVYWHKAAQKWCAEIRYNNKKQYLGLFKTPKEASIAYNIRAKELFGEYYSE